MEGYINTDGLWTNGCVNIKKDKTPFSEKHLYVIEERMQAAYIVLMADVYSMWLQFKLKVLVYAIEILKICIK